MYAEKQKCSIQNVLGNTDEMVHAICNMHALEMHARAVKWKWRESANAINENSHVTPYVLHFPDATWDRFPRSRVRGTCRCVVRHVLRYVASATRLFRSPSFS